MFLQNPANEEFRSEARVFYALSQDAGERPYTYYFHEHELPCLHMRNAIDVVMRGIWVEHENSKNESRNTPKENPQPEKETPVVIIGS